MAGGNAIELNRIRERRGPACLFGGTQGLYVDRKFRRLTPGIAIRKTDTKWSYCILTAGPIAKSANPTGNDQP